MSVFAILAGQHEHGSYPTLQEALDEVFRWTEGYADEIRELAIIRFGADVLDNELIAKGDDLVQLVLGGMSA